MLVAAIDQGTTSTRALTINSDGALRVVHSVEHRQFYPKPGWVEHNPEELIRNILGCANAVGNADALGIDNQGESCVAWDAKSKAALSQVIVWQDQRTTARIAELKAEGFEAETLARAGLPIDTYFSATKLAWIIENIPAAKDALARGTLRLGTTDAFFLDRLTGKCVTDVSTASRTCLMNLSTLQWDPVLCDLFGVPIESLPEIVPTTGDFGAIQTEHCAIAVTASVVDQQAALYGFGCRNPGEAKMTFGTGAFALMLTGSKIHRQPEQGLLPTVAWQLDGEPAAYALDGGIYTASAALNWARSLGLFTEFDDINNFDAPSAIQSGLVFVPALSGMGCPQWASHARGAWMGLSLEHGPKHLVQAILEGIALRAAQVIDTINTCVNLDGALPIDGGMSKNPYFCQFLADVLEREVRPASLPELTGLGTAQLAAKFLGHDLTVNMPFGTFKPQAHRRNARSLFDQACRMSLDWAQCSPDPTNLPEG